MDLLTSMIPHCTLHIHLHHFPVHVFLPAFCKILLQRLHYVIYRNLVIFVHCPGPGGLHSTLTSSVHLPIYLNFVNNALCRACDRSSRGRKIDVLQIVFDTSSSFKTKWTPGQPGSCCRVLRVCTKYRHTGPRQPIRCDERVRLRPKWRADILL